VAADPVEEYTFTGPSSGTIGVQSSQFTITMGSGDVSGNITFTPASSAGTGSFSPTTVVLSNVTRSGTFRYTPTSDDERDISVTNDGGLPEEPAITFTPTEPDPGPAAVDWTGSIAVLPGAHGERILIIPWDGKKNY
jgi:hypothetical protein